MKVIVQGKTYEADKLDLLTGRQSQQILRDTGTHPQSVITRIALSFNAVDQIEIVNVNKHLLALCAMRICGDSTTTWDELLDVADRDIVFDFAGQETEDAVPTEPSPDLVSVTENGQQSLSDSPV